MIWTHESPGFCHLYPPCIETDLSLPAPSPSGPLSRTYSASHSLFLVLSSYMLLPLCHCLSLCVCVRVRVSLSSWLPSCRFIINSSNFLMFLLFLAFAWPPCPYLFSHPLAPLHLHSFKIEELLLLFALLPLVSMSLKNRWLRNASGETGERLFGSHSFWTTRLCWKTFYRTLCNEWAAIYLWSDTLWVTLLFVQAFHIVGVILT